MAVLVAGILLTGSFLAASAEPNTGTISHRGFREAGTELAGAIREHEALAVALGLDESEDAVPVMVGGDPYLRDEEAWTVWGYLAECLGQLFPELTERVG